jgi:hypothetical protein
MLSHREDAEGATQETLAQSVTRIAVNYILDVKKSPVERLHLRFEQFAGDLASGLDLPDPSETERSVLIEEVKVGCRFAMLQCLDRSHRPAYLLGEIMDVSGPDAAEALEISTDLSANAFSTLAWRRARSRSGRAVWLRRYAIRGFEVRCTRCVVWANEYDL